MPEHDSHEHDSYDYELNRDNVVDEPEIQQSHWDSAGSDQGGPPRWLVPLLIVLVLLGALAAWWWWRSFKAAAAGEEPAVAEQPVSPSPAPTVEPQPQDETIEEPVTLATSDAILRRVVGTVSSHPRLAAWLVNDDLIDRFVKVTTNVAYGEDPKSHVPFLRPSRDFSATERGDRQVISSGSYARFTPAIEVLESLDGEGSAALYRRFEPAMEEAFAELGYPGSFRETLDRAVERVLAVKVPEANPEVEPTVLAFRFADPDLEGDSDFAKLLYRLGPDNQRRLRSEVRRLSAALENSDSP